jgi:hypothetical protein
MGWEVGNGDGRGAIGVDAGAVEVIGTTVAGLRAGAPFLTVFLAPARFAAGLRRDAALAVLRRFTFGFFR